MSSHKHPGTKWEWLRRRYLPRWWPTEGNVKLFNPAGVAIIYARYRRVSDATPWAAGVIVSPTT